VTNPIGHNVLLLCLFECSIICLFAHIISYLYFHLTGSLSGKVEGYRIGIHLTTTIHLIFLYSVYIPATDWTTEESEFESRWVQEFSFSISSRLALGPSQPPNQWVPGALSSGIKLLGCQADHWPLTTAEVKKMWASTTPPPNTCSWRNV
jgi:hypothetical protein